MANQSVRYTRTSSNQENVNEGDDATSPFALWFEVSQTCQGISAREFRVKFNLRRCVTRKLWWMSTLGDRPKIEWRKVAHVGVNYSLDANSENRMRTNWTMWLGQRVFSAFYDWNSLWCRCWEHKMKNGKFTLYASWFCSMLSLPARPYNWTTSCRQSNIDSSSS